MKQWLKIFAPQPLRINTAPQICCITLAISITFLAIWYDTRVEDKSSEVSLKMYLVLLYSCLPEVSQLFESLSTLIKEDAFWMARRVVCLFAHPLALV
jgi:hypothetical protein